MATKYFTLEAKPVKTATGAVCSQSTSNAGKESYHVAYVTSGVDAGFMVNPQSIYYNEGILTGVDKQRDKPMIELREVAKETFDYYFKFLETGNVTFLRHAERSVA